jgi:RNA polymerase sigma-B factor
VPDPGAAVRTAQHDLLLRYHVDGDLAARAQVAEQLLPLAHSLAARYINRLEPYDDLVQVACVGLMKAIDGFDPSRHTAFSSYATPTILGEIKRHFRDRTSAVRPPRRLQELQVRVDQARSTLTSESGRGPTVSELADAVDASPEDVLAAIQAHRARHTRSLSAPTGDGATLGDSLGRSDPALSLAEIRVLLGGAIGILPERERRILRLRFEHDLTQRQIADIMGISQMTISRLIRVSLDRLRIAIGEDPPAAPANQLDPIGRAA